MNNVICPACGGDGKETCSNPDHGFLTGIVNIAYSANESACPCCGHDQNHKVKNGGNCELCNGLGNISEENANKWANEVGYGEELVVFHH